MVNVGYQKRDFNFFNYNLYTIRDAKQGKSFVLRGPAPNSLTPREYFTSLGAAFTYGCYTGMPYTQLVSETLDIPAINLGTEGAGPSYYTRSDNKTLLDLINHSKFVIIAFMSGRSCSNSLFVTGDHGSQEKLYLVNEDKENPYPAHKLYEWLLQNYEPDFVKNIIEETRNNYIQDFIKLLSSIEVPKILFWFSKRKPEYQEKYDGQVWQLFGKFPHLVNASMVEQLKEYADEYIECVTTLGTPQPLFDRFTGEQSIVYKNPDYGYSSSNYNLYYASPEMHLEAANSLLESCVKFGVNTQTQNRKKANLLFFIQIDDFFKNMKEIHLDNFFHSFDFSKYSLLGEIELKNYTFNNFGKEIAENITASNTGTNHSYVNTHNLVQFLINSRSSEVKKESSDVIYDVIPFLLSKPSHVSVDSLFHRRNNYNTHQFPVFLYAVMCTPRSGSTFLCDLLRENIGGNPIEHLRQPLLYILKNRYRLKIDLPLFVTQILKYCSDEETFGTKIISHFFFDFVRALTKSEQKMMVNLFSQFKIIYLYRSDKHAQAVSQYIAYQTKHWHATSENSLKHYQEKLQSVSYNYESLKNRYKNLVEEERQLYSFLIDMKFKNVLCIEYESFLKYPQKNLQKICKFLNLDTDAKSVTIESTYQVLSSSSLHQDFIERFKKEDNIEY